MNRLLICAASLASISAYAGPKLAAAEEAPKLVVVVVVDQMRRSEIDTLAPHFTGGFRRLLKEGARLDGHHGQQNTYTGPGPRADPVGVLRLPERHLSEQVV